MPGKHLTRFSRHSPKEKRRRAATTTGAKKFPPGFGLRQPSGAFVLVVLLAAASLSRTFADAANSAIPEPKFLGSQTCSSSSCHGGASEKNNQYTIWSTHDFHHARPYATLETARSERLADVLKIGNPTQSARCTVCHAPFATVPSDRLGHDAQITEGVSCETCHGPAENWIRSHTRPDYTHADRVTAGMRDLKNLYVRANTCVACHQNIDPEIRAAGHPELIFEMDGQSVAMPRHWAKSGDRPGPQIWLVGQLVAEREIFQPTQSLKSDEEIYRGSAARFVASAATDALKITPKPPVGSLTDPWSDADLAAKKASELVWSQEQTRACLGAIANLSAAFTNKVDAQCAERVVLALDRLTAGLSDTLTNSAVNQSLNKLFADAQSLPDFDPNQFAKDLNTFHSSVAGFLETK